MNETQIAATWAAQCSEQKQQYPPGCQNGKARDHTMLDQKVQQLCSAIREEQAKELVKVGMGNNAASKCHAKAILKSTLAKQ